MYAKADSPPIMVPDAIQRLSPNQDDRPAGTSIDLLVIHSISLPPGEFGGPWIEDLFFNRLDPQAHPFFQLVQQLKVSSHLLIRRDGAMIQYVPLDRRAWHAGSSSFCGKTQCNDYSIGIELEGTDHQAYTEAQYKSLIQASHFILQRFPAITPERITGHADISPGRKTDPGPSFDWQYYRRKLNQHT